MQEEEEEETADEGEVPRRRRSLRWVGRAAVLSLVLAVGWISGPTMLLNMQADYRTGAGEIRTALLIEPAAGTTSLNAFSDTSQ